MTDLPMLPAAPYPAFDGSQACARFPYEVFFPLKSAHPSEYTQPKAVCFTCPFKPQCVAYSLSHRVEGIWGGMSFHERNQIRSAMGVRAQVVAVGDIELVHRRIDALDDGTRSMADIARGAGCSARTVERRLKQRQIEGAA